MGGAGGLGVSDSPGHRPPYPEAFSNPDVLIIEVCFSIFSTKASFHRHN